MFHPQKIILCLSCFFTFSAGLGEVVMAQGSVDTTVKKLIADLNHAPDGLEKADKYFGLAKYYVDKPGEAKDDLQNAQAYCSAGLKIGLQQNSVARFTRGYAIQAQILREKGDQAKARVFADKAMSQINQVTDPVTLADVYFEKSSYYSISSDSDVVQKVKYYRLATSYLKQVMPNSLKLADALKYLGDLYGIQQGGNAASLQCLKESLAIYNANKYEKLQDIYDLIGYTLSRMERRREGLKYSLMAVRTAERLKDSSMTTSTIYNRLSYTYNNLKEDKKAAEAMEKAVMYARHNHDETTTDILTSNLAVAYIDLKNYNRALQLVKQALANLPKDQDRIRILFTIDLVRIYTAMKNYPLAETLYGSLQKMVTGSTQWPIIYDLMYAAGINLFMQVHDYKKVDELIEVYRGVTVKTQNLMTMAKVEFFAYKADSAQQRYREAFLHHQAYQKLNDSLVARNHDKETAQLQLQYETEKKDQDIAIKTKDIQLLTRQTELQQAALHNEAIIRNLSVLAVGMLLILSGVIYSRYKLKRRTITELEEQKEEINTQNDYLKQLVTEREWLVKEVHHRVKNNLQIVVSLLNSQAGLIDNALAREVIRESKNRINAISIIHQKLYQTDDMAGVAMYHYIRELVEYIAISFNVDDMIVFSTEVDHITLDVSQAVPVGLILNEALTNAVKYAVLPDRKTRIKVSLTCTDGIISLSVADNGNGLIKDIDLENLNSLGMILMNGLSKQLGSQLTFQNKDGLELSLKFKRSRLLGEPLVKVIGLNKETLV